MNASDIAYLNHAGTSWPKPDAVVAATKAATRSSPDEWSKLFEHSALEVAKFFHVKVERLLFTPSCTAALNVAISDMPWQAGDRIITSHFEHHALHRNLSLLEQRGVEVVTIPPGGDELMDLRRLEAELSAAPVRLVAVTAACNVTGQLLPVREIIVLAHRSGSLALIDGAQIAGWWDLNLAELGADLFTFAGHKGPQAPNGVGALYVAPGTRMACQSAACNITAWSKGVADMPGYCDVGSVNLCALAGLAAGCQWLSEPEQRSRLDDALQLAKEFADLLREDSRFTFYHEVSFARRMPTVAFSLQDVSSDIVADRMAQAGIIVASGWQCAPRAHEALGTSDSGVVRCSFGMANETKHVEAALAVLSDLKIRRTSV